MRKSICNLFVKHLLYLLINIQGICEQNVMDC